MFGGSGGHCRATEFRAISLFGNSFGIFGHDGFLLSGQANDSGDSDGVSVSIGAGQHGGDDYYRRDGRTMEIFGVRDLGAVMTMLVYPVFGNWVWGGGWLSQLGANFGLGHGHVDFAGSSVVHMAGGVAAAVGCWMLGPRIGKYNRNGTVNVLIAHNAPMYMLGTLILAFGWFGFTGGHCIAGDLNIGRVATNTAIASAGGAVASMLYLWRLYKKPDPSFICNGLLAGLVAISAPCAVRHADGRGVHRRRGGNSGRRQRAVLRTGRKARRSGRGDQRSWRQRRMGNIGAGAVRRRHVWPRLEQCALVSRARRHVEMGCRDDSPTVLPDGWTEQGVTGLFYGNGSQFVAECVGLGLESDLAGDCCVLLFWLIDRFVGNRVSMATELQGLGHSGIGRARLCHRRSKTDDSIAAGGRRTTAGDARRNAGQTQFSIIVEGVEIADAASSLVELCQPIGTAAGGGFSWPSIRSLRRSRETSSASAKASRKNCGCAWSDC